MIRDSSPLSSDSHEGEFGAGFHRVRNVLMYVSRAIGAIPPVRVL
ncbi:MAG TPA: hypothetical protein VF381_12395 [Thermoanaerobaculia bacterium]